MTIQRRGAERRIIAEQAARWVCDLRSGSFGQQTEFLAWLKQSPQHVAEYFFADTIWREVRNANLESVEIPADPAELARAEHADANVIRLASGGSSSPDAVASRNGRTGRRSRRFLPRLAAIAAGATLLALGLWWASGQMPPETQTYATEVGEQRAFKLKDGSLLHLNAHSRVEVLFSANARRLRLLEGEALFTVQRDPNRPFLVDAGRAVIQALGTQFNVYLRTHETTVAVLSGAVQVSTQPEGSGDAGPAPATGQTPQAAKQPAEGRLPRRLSAGQEMRITASGETLRSTPDAENALAWRERRLVFQGEPLAEVAEEFNRYNQRRIRVEGSDARSKLLSGTFDADNPESLILFLRKLEDLEVEASESELVIRVR